MLSLHKSTRSVCPASGLTSSMRLGVPALYIRRLSSKIGKDHDLAMKLWDSGIYQARILAPMVADPNVLTEKQMEKIAYEIVSWDICDNVCGELFTKS